MNTTSSPSRLSRRRFLKLLATGGATIAGGYLLWESAPWLDYDQQVNLTQKPLEKNQSGPQQLRELVRYATLAANGHNTQPWKFAIQESTVEIHPDYARRLTIVDPQDRELWISLGCALENLLIAASAAGYASEVIYPDSTDVIRVRLTTDTPHASPLFEAIPLRQNVRSEYDGQLVNSHDLDQIQALMLEPGVSLRFATNQPDLAVVLDYVQQGNLNQYADRAFIAELIQWLRFTKKEALASLDGLYTLCSGNLEVPRWLGRMFVSGTTPQQQADIDAKKLRSSAGAVIVASESEDKVAWVRVGQVYERLALTLTRLNIQSAFLNQPIEVADVRDQFQSALGLGTARPQLLLRYGYASAMPRSLRRPVEQVLLPA
ncbi:MAG: twin-arginine translocation signal domain-containing protein [Anaerolineae bacterium]